MEFNKIMLLKAFGVELISFFVVGFIFIGSSIFQFDNTASSFTMYGISAILLLTLFDLRSIKYYLAAALLVFAYPLIKSYGADSSVLIRNLLWIVLIILIVYLTRITLSKEYFSGKKYLSVTIWMLSFAVIYLIMGILNLYAFKLYTQGPLMMYVKLGLRMGFIMGLGIGIGYEASLKYRRNLLNIKSA